jgi:hypothetical protein
MALIERADKDAAFLRLAPPAHGDEQRAMPVGALRQWTLAIVHLTRFLVNRPAQTSATKAASLLPTDPAGHPPVGARTWKDRQWPAPDPSVRQAPPRRNFGVS